MVKEHYLDGKIVSDRLLLPSLLHTTQTSHADIGRFPWSGQIDPKRAIPRPEVGAVVRQDKLFVRQIPQSMDYPKFKEYFSQFGGIVDSNLMIDRETGQHRGFGFVTYDDPAGVQNALSQQHYFDGQEVRSAFLQYNTVPALIPTCILPARGQDGNSEDAQSRHLCW